MVGQRVLPLIYIMARVGHPHEERSVTSAESRFWEGKCARYIRTCIPHEHEYQWLKSRQANLN